MEGICISHERKLIGKSRIVKVLGQQAYRQHLQMKRKHEHSTKLYNSLRIFVFDLLGSLILESLANDSVLYFISICCDLRQFFNAYNGSIPAWDNDSWYKQWNEQMLFTLVVTRAILSTFPSTFYAATRINCKHLDDLVAKFGVTFSSANSSFSNANQQLQFVKSTQKYSQFTIYPRCSLSEKHSLKYTVHIRDDW